MKLYFFTLLFLGVLTAFIPPAPKLPQRAYRQYGAVGQVGRLAFGIRIEVGVRRV